MSGGSRVGTFFRRLLIAHVVAYPIAIFWMVGSMPLCLAYLAREIDAAEGSVVLAGISMPAATAIVTRALLWIGAGVFVLEHVFGVVWGLIGAGDGDRGRRAFTVVSFLYAAVGVIGGTGAWVWLVTRGR